MSRRNRYHRARSVTGGAPRLTLLCAGIVAATVGRPVDVSAQRLIGVGRGGGEFGGSYEATRLNDRGGRGSGGDDYRLWLGLPLSGSLIGPQLFSYDLVLQPVWTWQRRAGFDAAQRLRQMNLSFAASLLANQPIGLSANGSTFSSTAAGGLGGSREYSSSNRGAQLWIRYRPLPMQVNFNRQALDETWRTPGVVIAPRNATVQRTIRFSASNSKTILEAQRLDHEDLLGDQDYSARNARALHVFRWGRASRLESSYETARQEGVFPYRRKEWRERLDLYHSARVRTEYVFSRLENGNAAGVVSNRFLSGGTTITLGPWATLGAVASRTTSRSGTAREDVNALAPRFSFWLGRSSGLQMSGNLLLGVETRRVAGVDAEAAVVDEPHDVPGSRLITLDQPDGLPGGLLVRKADGQLVFLEGQDFEVLVLGRFVGLRIPPSSRIAVGDRLLVSYRYRVPAEDRRTALRSDVGLSLTYQGFSLRHQRSLKRTAAGADLALSGSTVPSDFDEARTSLGLRTDSPIGHLDAAAGWRIRERKPERTEDLEFSTTLTPPRIGSMEGSLSLLWSSARTNGRRQDGWTFSAAAAGSLARRLTLGAAVESGILTQSDAGDIRYLIGRLNTTWQINQISAEAGLDLYRQSRPIIRSTGRLSLRIIRRF